MSIPSQIATLVQPMHPWLSSIRVAVVPGPTTPLLQQVVDGLLQSFRLLGHHVQDRVKNSTDVLLTTSRLGEPMGWREAMLFTARRRFRLSRSPMVYTLVHAPTGQLERLLQHLGAVLPKEPPDPADYAFPGLAPDAYRVLFEQGRRGGPILALERLVQAQSKCLRIILVVGDDRPLAAYHFDLAGAYPRTEGHDMDAFLQDIALRMVTAASASEVTQHQVTGGPIPRAVWQHLSTPEAMCVAGQHLEERHFFTEMVRISDLVHVPAVEDSVASQYSEGCFATWEPELPAMIATVTGSIRPVDKGNIREDDLAVIVGVRPDGKGALVRHVEGKKNDPPSSEAVEMMDVDSVLPMVALDPSWGISGQVPVVRSKLHGHRSIASYDPSRVEYVALDQPYYHYLVSCATDAQARGIRGAFARSQALQKPGDPRQVVFTILPGHGVVLAEKWVPGTAPLQVLWEYMDAGYLQVASQIPQGPMEYVARADGKVALRMAEEPLSGLSLGTAGQR